MADGMRDGSRAGGSVRTRAGLADGRAAGALVGCDISRGVGCSAGITAGFADCHPAGALVGDAAGMSIVGGTIVDAPVGAVVGTAVGLSVGAAVGLIQGGANVTFGGLGQDHFEMTHLMRSAS